MPECYLSIDLLFRRLLNAYIMIYFLNIEAVSLKDKDGSFPSSSNWQLALSPQRLEMEYLKYLYQAKRKKKRQAGGFILNTPSPDYPQDKTFIRFHFHKEDAHNCLMKAIFSSPLPILSSNGLFSLSPRCRCQL